MIMVYLIMMPLAYDNVFFAFIEGQKECSRTYGHTYDPTTRLCQCGSHDACFLGSLKGTVCHDGRCRCSQDIDKCDESSQSFDVCVGGICENLMGKLIEIINVI